MATSLPHDAFGPEYAVELYDAKTGMRGFLVIDNTVLGQGKGGIRMTPGVTLEEVYRLARTMTWKNALAEIPFGGAKAGMLWDGDLKKKEELVRAFARAIKPFVHKYYVGGPDVGSGETEMQWIAEETRDMRAVTGKPATLCMVYMGKKGEKCGLPHEYGSTGFGVAHATKVAAETTRLPLKNATVAIHGFGNVGTFAFRILTQMGAKVVAVADRDTGLYAQDGLDEGLFIWGEEKKKLSTYKGKVKKITPEDVLALDVDILIPASVTDVINNSNKKNIRANIIVEAGNIPMSEAIEGEFYRKGKLVVPDFVANAGGVISSYAEYRGYNPKRMFDLVERKITKNTRRVLRESASRKISPREAALAIARERIGKRQAKKNGTALMNRGA